MRKITIMSFALGFGFFAHSQETFEMVKDIHPTGNSSPRNFVQQNGSLYFTAWDGVNGNSSFKQELWKTDGTEAGTELIKVITTDSTHVFGSNVLFPTSYAGEVYFYARQDATTAGLWKTDGTEVGTQFIKSMPAPGKIITALGKLFAIGIELWVSDGTEAGTQILKKTNPTLASNPRLVTEMNGKLYFVATNQNLKNAWWESDGTEAGTNMLFEFDEGVAMTAPFITWNNRIYYVAADGYNGARLWVTDGTQSGTKILKHVKPGGNPPDHEFGFTLYNDKIYFPGNDDVHGNELWVSDGTETGTYMLKDINTNTTSSNGHGSPIGMTVYNGLLYFSADDDVHRRELWVTDGTEQGTKMVKDIDAFLSSDPRDFVVYNNVLYFTAEPSAAVRKLYKTDGTEQGTVQVAPANATEAKHCNQTQGLYVFDGSLYLSANFTNHGYELWKLTTAPVSVPSAPEKKRFQVYPNPVGDVLHILSDKTLHLSLIDMMGRVLQTLEVQREGRVSLAHLPAGLYLLRDSQTGSSVQVVKR